MINTEKKILQVYRQAGLKQVALEQAEEELRAAQLKRQKCHEELVEAKDKLQRMQWRVDDVVLEEVTAVGI